MRQVLVVFIACVVLSYAVKLERPMKNALAQIKEKASVTDWGVTFHQLIELSLHHSKTSEVIAKIKQLRDQLINDQQSADAENQKKSAQFENDIQTLQNQLETLSNEQRLTNIQIIDIDNDIASLLGTHHSLKSQLDLLNGREEDIRNTRATDEENFQHRTTTGNRAIDALNQIISLLTDAVFNQKNKATVLTEVEKSTVVHRLREELGQDNALAMLVSLTTKFDAPTVTKIIERLEKLRDSILKNLASDQQQYNEAQIRFTTLIFQLQEVRNRLAQDFATVSSALNRRKNDRAQAQVVINQLEIDVPLTESTYQKTQQEYDLVSTTYSAKKQSRAKELEIIVAAYELIVQASDQLESGEQDYKNSQK